MKEFRILIVDTMNSYRKVFKDTLQKSFPDINIDEATDGREALEKVSTFLPDLIFMEIGLPDENGLELAKKIRAIDPTIRIAMVTNFDIPECREVASKCKADHFLIKSSLSSMEMEKLVNSYLNSPTE